MNNNAFKLIEIVVLDHEDYETDRLDFCTMKEAREWVKRTGLDEGFWNRRAESENDYHGWAKNHVATLQLHVDGDIMQDWFPKWSQDVADAFVKLREAQSAD